MKTLTRLLILVAILIGLSDCGKKSPEAAPIAKPAHLLSKNEMVNVLLQIHLLEANINLKNAQNQTKNRRDTVRTPDIFRKYQIDYPVFKENFDYYSSQPTVLLSIYDEVLIELTRMQAEEERKKS